MSGKDTHDERVLGYDRLNRRDMLLAGSTLAAVSALSSSPSSADQAGASGAYSNRSRSIRRCSGRAEDPLATPPPPPPPKPVINNNSSISIVNNNVVNRNRSVIAGEERVRRH